MKPDDILSAIGDVEEKYVRKAHRKDLVKALAWFFGTLAVLLAITGSLMEPDYILSRINGDGTVNEGYVEQEHLAKEQWTTLEYTSFEDGEETARTVFRRSLYDHYSVTRTTAQGEKWVLMGKAGSAPSDYVGKRDIGTLYMETYYSQDLIGRIDSMLIGSRFAHETPYTVLNYLRFEYLDNGAVSRQVRYARKEPESIVGWRNISTVNGKPAKTEDFNADGNLLGYTEYTYQDSFCNTKSYTAGGTLTGSTESRYDWFGTLREKEIYDAGGSLIGREVYRYWFWERYLSLEGLVTLFVCICFAATLGIASWEERLRLPRRKAAAAEFAGKLDGVRKAIGDARAALEAMDEETRVQAREQLAGEVKALERLLAKLKNTEREDET